MTYIEKTKEKTITKKLELEDWTTKEKEIFQDHIYHIFKVVNSMLEEIQPELKITEEDTDKGTEIKLIKTYGW